MATLYELDARLEEFLSEIWMDGDTAIDKRTGEILDSAALDHLQLEYREKVDNIGCYIKQLLADAEMYEKEAQWQASRAKRAKNRAAALKEYLQMHIKQGERFTSSHCEISWGSADKVTILDEALIPEEYLKRETVIQKAEIKKRLQKEEAIPGAVLTKTVYMKLK